MKNPLRRCHAVDCCGSSVAVVKGTNVERRGRGVRRTEGAPGSELRGDKPSHGVKGLGRAVECLA